MKIKVSNLQDGTYNFDFNDDVEELNIGEPFFGKYHTKISLTKFRDQLILEASTDISAKLVCDRCADEFESVINSKYKMVYLGDAGIKQSDSLDVTYLSPDVDKFDVSSDVRDYSLLSVPMKKLCKEECKGLCYRCGKNLNQGNCSCVKNEIDERWNPLLDT